MAADPNKLLLVAPFAPKTRVQYFDSRDVGETNEYLDDEELESKFAEMVDLVENEGPIPQHMSEAAAPSFILVTSTGVPVNPEKPLQISTKMLRSLMNAGLVHARMGDVYNETRAHHSLFVEYDANNTSPIAIHVLLRAIMRTDSIHCALRIRLKDLSCVCLLSAELPNTITVLRHRCIRHVNPIKSCPLQLVHIIIENATDALNSWVYRLWKRVEFLEDATGMTPRFHVARIDSLDSRRLTILLRDLHAVHVELRIALTNVKSSAGLVPWLISVMDKLEALRAELGAPALKPGHRAQLQDQAKFNETVLLNMAEKVMQLLDRVKAQINVAYSLIAQKGNEQNYQIAKLTAADSRTMKAITVLTLTFLPGTMLASLWDAGIFTLAQDRSWKIYVGTTCGLTLLVFALWFVYVKVATHGTSADGGDEEKRFVDKDWLLYNAGQSLL